ncbi:PhzF family phenazine biosynthesis protein [Psychromonas ossibalaenae]|uniref:PhzF family phenazine biosynthesis protein n=1 Tax=Psychromonas ossibalaenae TaxID=444922 RepID=UPI000380BAD5|nr:PhzF family phenazine biosynthesis protein [Psychromonas ossibalaenae]
MELEIYQVDSFTTEPFKGNPAGVCITEQALDQDIMFSIAEEMAVSETAFLSLSDMRLRWFTPKVEVCLCGHGTLAMAHVLKEKGMTSAGDTLVFNTVSGALLVTIQEQTIEMDFPSPILNICTPPNKKLLNFLGIDSERVISFAEFDSKNLIEIDSEQALLDLTPNFAALKELNGRGVVVTVKSAASELDFISRYFAPWVGVNEDPVTGSAHCALAVYWEEKLQKSKLKGYQASERGGFVDVELLPDNRVQITGTAVTTLRGTLYV